MLAEHLVDLLFGKLVVQRGATNGDEFGEGLAEGVVLCVRLLDMAADGLCEVAKAALEIVHRALELAFCQVSHRTERTTG